MYILLLKYCNIRYVFFILCGNKDYCYYYYYYSRKLLFYSKEQSLYCYKELWLKTSRKERSNWRLLLPGSTRTIPELFDKKMWTKNRRVFTALDLTECLEMVREWVYLFLQTVKKRLPKSETSQSDPEWKGNIVLHFGPQGLH